MKNEELKKLLKEKGLTNQQIDNLLGNKSYWDNRFEQLQVAQINMAADYYATLDEQFNKACSNIQADIEKWYMRFSNNEGITLAEARRMNKAPDERERLKAAELIGKRYAMWTDKLEANVQQQVVFTNEQELED